MWSRTSYWHFKLLSLVSSLSGASDAEDFDGLPRQESLLAAALVDSLTPSNLPKKRKTRCPSEQCKVEKKDHNFGVPRKMCTGPPEATQTAKEVHFASSNIQPLAADDLIPSSSSAAAPKGNTPSSFSSCLGIANFSSFVTKS